MKSRNRSRSILIFTILFAYIFLQFLWWEILLVRQSSELINEKQKLKELTISEPAQLQSEIESLHQSKKLKIYMIVGEGTVFLLLLLYGIYRIKKAYESESQLISQQKNFLLSVTHELKTPIAATKLQLQTLIKHKHLSEEQKADLLEKALNETNRLNRLIEDVLLANSAEKNELITTKEKINISEYTVSIIQNYFGSLVKNGSLKLTIQNGIYLETDKLLFPSLLINLIENALKYSGENPLVSVYLNSEKGKITLEVGDNGIGIPVHERENIFKKFYRIGNEETRKTKGTGLGLYIVKRIVESHSGSIKIMENQPNGSVFQVVF